jgi:hypothetical protein
MPNIRPLLTFLEIQDPLAREKIYAYSDRLLECGYEIPSGERLRAAFERRQKQEREDSNGW